MRAARDLVMQGACLTLVSRVTILPECMCSRALHGVGDIAGNIADIMAVANTYALVRARYLSSSTLKILRDERNESGTVGKPNAIFRN